MPSFSGAARRITSADIQDAAARLGCEYAALRAVMAVESRNSGFDAKRRPIILFEPHVFYRNLPRGGAKIAAAVAAGLAYPKWGAKPYPKSSDGNYDRLARAIEIDEEAAYRAVSIGMGQVLGENYRAAGHASAKEMFAAAMESEAAQLGHMIGFIKTNRLDDDLRLMDWAPFARGYNGPGQVPKYSAWLAREYAKWSKIAAVPREEITKKELRAAGSRTIEGTDKSKSAVIGTAIAGGGLTVLELASKAQDISSAAASLSNAVETGSSAVETGSNIFTWARGHWELIAVGVLLFVIAYLLWRNWCGAVGAQDARVDDARTGLNTGR